MFSISRLIRTAALVALAFLSVVPAFAQGGASLLTGTVKDVNGGVLPGVTVKDWRMVGGYAIQFDFSDGHNTGLYTFDYLKAL